MTTSSSNSPNKNQSKAKNSAPELSPEQQVAVRREKLTKLREEKRAYPHGITVEHSYKDFIPYAEEHDVDKLTAAGKFHVAGRVIFIRSFGKAGFVKIRDRHGDYQMYVAKDNCTEENFADFKNLDLGDIVCATGTLFRTKTKELTLATSSFSIVVKSLQPPPEKYHGLKDIEERYRKRYVDLMTNPESKQRFLARSKIVQQIREFFLERDFLEVETPMMHPLVSGAAAKPFVTHHNTLDMDLFLRIAPELYLKRLVVGGMERVFEVNRNFRNEGMSVRHNPEFTMLEFYMAYATYDDLMNLTEELIVSLVKGTFDDTTIKYQDYELNFASPWKRISVEQAVKEMSHFRGSLQSTEEMSAYLKKKGMDLSGREGPGSLLMTIFEEDVESQLVQPTFVTHYPVEVSPLARRADQKSPEGFDVTERFELFIAKNEIANGFNELNDPDDQADRFNHQRNEKESGNDEACDYDEDYITALEYGLPPTAGEGIGIDRLVMLLTDAASIRDVILFPQMRKES